MKSYTDLEQSKKLAEILPLESADNVIVSFGNRDGVKTVVMPKETFDTIKTPFSDIRKIIPCWSLSALIGVLKDGALDFTNSRFRVYSNGVTKYMDNPIDACYEMIIKLHEQKLL